jgi:hypothetical protein
MKLKSALLCIAAVVLNSCLGVSASITIKADGSGKLALEYRVSQALESIGRLDGNESRPAIPVGRADFERSAARIPGLKLSKYSSKEIPGASGGRDLVTKVTLDFKDTGALLAFLDGTGSRAALVEENGGASKEGKLLRLSLLDPSETVSNRDLLALLREISGGYEFGISFSLPNDACLTVIPASVQSAAPSAKLEANGKKVSFSIGMRDLLNLNEGLALEIRW